MVGMARHFLEQYRSPENNNLEADQESEPAQYTYSPPALFSNPNPSPASYCRGTARGTSAYYRARGFTRGSRATRYSPYSRFTAVRGALSASLKRDNVDRELLVNRSASSGETDGLSTSEAAFCSHAQCNQEAKQRREIKSPQHQIPSSQAQASPSEEVAALQKFLQEHLTTNLDVNPPTEKLHIVEVDGIPFRVIPDGSKLIRLTHDSRPTPRATKVAGVQFFRSKNGNLHRWSIVKNRLAGVKSTKLCRYFTSTGWCAAATSCPFVHDPQKVAICREYLAKGFCSKGNECGLTHEPDAHRVPACAFFAKGSCTNEHCRYPHVIVDPTAPVCRAFGELGYCDRGGSCPNRHAFECPSYSNTGACHRRNCRLPHIDHVDATQRSLADRRTATDGKSDVSTEDEMDMLDADGFESDDLMEDDFSAMHKRLPDADDEFVQQNDYIAL